MRKRIKGDRSFTRLIKRLPEAVRQELTVELHLAGREALAEQQSKAPVGRGALKRGLSMKVLPKTLRLRVGLIGKPINKKLFYGWIQDKGRKAQTVIVARRNVLAEARKFGGRSNSYKNIALKNKIKGTYKMRVRGMAPKRFVSGVDRERIFSGFRDIWNKALNKAAAGVGDE